MANKIGVGAAIAKAESAAAAWYASVKAKVDAFVAGGDWKVGVKNDGTTDFVTPDVEKSVAWNKLDAKAKKGVDEKKWKETWIKDNAKRV